MMTVSRLLELVDSDTLGPERTELTQWAVSLLQQEGYLIFGNEEELIDHASTELSSAKSRELYQSLKEDFQWT